MAKRFLGVQLMYCKSRLLCERRSSSFGKLLFPDNKSHNPTLLQNEGGNEKGKFTFLMAKEKVSLI
uniref:Uncharacterized protein n=1 Tax=Rhizophora mucronata TaxID=61149 RepID=A0A2P2PJA9_RHIMU